MAAGIIAVDRDALNRTREGLNDKTEAWLGDLRIADGPEWLNSIDLFVIGTPPQAHAEMAETLSLRFPEAVIVSEKPLLVSKSEAMRLHELESRLGNVAVMHNFQFARGFRRVKKALDAGQIGNLTSIQALQWSTKSRRLPSWYRDLPFGLFWDESAHFFYLLESLVHGYAIDSARIRPSSDREDPTPDVVRIDGMSRSGIPLSVDMQFRAGVSEWGLILNGTKGTLIYDMFRDVSLHLPFDGQHLAPQILRTSLAATFHHWRGVLVNGTRVLRGRLHYGIDTVLEMAASSTGIGTGGGISPEISVRSGLEISRHMRTVVEVAR